jgi:hypothetical protein
MAPVFVFGATEPLKQKHSSNHLKLLEELPAVHDGMPESLRPNILGNDKELRNHEENNSSVTSVSSVFNRYPGTAKSRSSG